MNNPVPASNHLPWIQRFFLSVWSKKGIISSLLLPLSFVFTRIARRRLRIQSTHSTELIDSISAPVIVVGNINVGGSGKSPVVIALVNELRARGFRPGVISRGYGRQKGGDTLDLHQPVIITNTSSASSGGDEPLMIAMQANCPVVVSPDRCQAATVLLANSDCDIIISDDGLQHYKLPRAIEICLVDEAALGNHRCLPAGPLREPLTRLQSVDYCLSRKPIDSTLCASLNLYAIRPAQWWNIHDKKYHPLSPLPWSECPVNAITGIARGERFFNTLSDLGLAHTSHQYPDHYRFTVNDFELLEGPPVIMTMKDAVKCTAFAKPDWWALMVNAELPTEFIDSLVHKLKRLGHHDR